MKLFPIFILFFIILIAACSQPKTLAYKNIQNFKLSGLGLTKSTVSMDVCLYNPNKYCIKIKDADVDVYVNQSFIGKMFFVDGSYTIPKSDTFLLPVKVDVDLKNVLPNAIRLLFDKNIDVKVTGKIKAGKHGVYVAVPINYEGKHEI